MVYNTLTVLLYPNQGYYSMRKILQTMNVNTALKPMERVYLPQELKITVWSRLKPYYSELNKRPIHTKAELVQWIYDKCELTAVIQEEFNWRYIKLSLDSNDERALESYSYAIQELEPKISTFEQILNQKLIDCSLTKELDQQTFFIYLRGIKSQLALYREENIPLFTEMAMKAKEHGTIFSEMTIKFNGEDKTLQQATALLAEPDRKLREEIYHKFGNRLLQDVEPLDRLMDDLLKIRHDVALNAGFENYRDYKFKDLGRFDYTAEHCFNFHNSIANEIVPIIDELDRIRQKDLNIDTLRPWDMQVDTSGKKPLRPFIGAAELIKKSIDCMKSLDPYFGECIQIMDAMQHLDLDSRKGKRPGGYNMPLPSTGVPFIFMNAADSVRDMRTMMHEGGHAVHSFLTRNYRLSSSKKMPSEVAELAAMTMELLTMDYWDSFFEDKNDLKRAKIWQLEKVLSTLPWVATIDKFQHWLYTNPEHSKEERKEVWMKIYNEFSSNVVDRTGLDSFSTHLWHRQLHVFEVPFYYIEYGMAQLGAIAIWKRYRENPKQALAQYTDALRLGYTQPIGTIYETAGIKFEFSSDYVRELGAFIKKEIEDLIFEA